MLGVNQNIDRRLYAARLLDVSKSGTGLWGRTFRNLIQQQYSLGTTLGTTPSPDFMGFYGVLRNIGRVLFPPDFQFDLRLVELEGLEPPTFWFEVIYSRVLNF